eukprot:scaffold2117_cov245-Chaetoceros_neogracile.AAC.4
MKSSCLLSFSYIILLLECAPIESSKFQFQGPILTLTLKDPFEEERYQQHQLEQQQEQSNNGKGKGHLANNDRHESAPASDSNKSWWKRFQPEPQIKPLSNIFNLPSLSPTILYGIRSINPLPNYFPLLKSTTATASYNYHDLRNKPNFIEGDMKLYSDKFNMDMDIGASYNVRQKSTALSLRLGSLPPPPALTDDDDDKMHEHYSSAPQPLITVDKGSVLLQAIISKRKSCFSFLRGQYNLHLPFTQSISSLTITPTYSFLNPTEESQCSIVAKSGSGRTASILDLNKQAPTLSVIHALDHRNTIQPEISLLDAKIRYNWSVKLNDRGGSIKMRVDPIEAVQVTWVDEAGDGSGKWVTDFRLPLGTGNGGLNGVGNGSGNFGVGGGKQGRGWKSDIRVRRQFVF